MRFLHFIPLAIVMRLDPIEEAMKNTYLVYYNELWNRYRCDFTDIFNSSTWLGTQTILFTPFNMKESCLGI